MGLRERIRELENHEKKMTHKHTGKVNNPGSVMTCWVYQSYK